MLQTTQAIVLRLQPHTDRSHILHAYTELYGRTNFLIYGLSSKKKAGAHFPPLSIVEISADIVPTREIQTIRQIHLSYIPSRISVDPIRQSVALFLSEILCHTLYHPMRDEKLYRFIEASVKELDACPDPQNAHLRFLVSLAAQMGFAIDEEIHPALVSIPTTRAERQEQLSALCEYFSQQMEMPLNLRSLDVLMELFD